MNPFAIDGPAEEGDAMTAEDQVVRVGDRLHISTELLRQIHEEPHHWSELVELVAIQVEANGAKVLVLKRCREDDQP